MILFQMAALWPTLRFRKVEFSIMWQNQTSTRNLHVDKIGRYVNSKLPKCVRIQRQTATRHKRRQIMSATTRLVQHK